MSKHNLATTAPEFFKTLIQRKMTESGVYVSAEVKDYLSDLLQFYIFTDHLFGEVSSSGKKHIKTLAETYLLAYSSPSSMKSALKKVGDTSLYLSGFFRESLKRKTVSLDYYITMGRKAYETLANLQNQILFKELADRFLDLMFILFRIQQHSLAKAPYLLSLINQYMDTHSPQEAKELVRYGINISFKKTHKTH